MAMLPSLVATELREAVRRFLVTSFPMTTAGFRRVDDSTMMGDFLAGPEQMFRGPYLSLGLPFRKSDNTSSLPFRHLDPGFSPYRHQLRAFERLCGPAPRSTLVATGTGSGKTECFTLPILDYCAGQAERGVKAIIIYPMNALAADQARRLAREVHGRPELRGRVSVGLYTGDETSGVQRAMTRDGVITCKDTLREHPPDVLLTNYKMLDFLLLRPRDQKLWRYNAPGGLRYLVVDELHTFDGAQGTDLACLVRRLRHRLGAQATLACVGTSATIGGASAVEDLMAYATQVFASPFEGGSVILEDRESPEDFLAADEVQYTNWPASAGMRERRLGQDDSTEDYLSAQALLWFGGDAPALDARDPEVARHARFELASRLRACTAFRELLKRAHGLADASEIAAEWAQRFRISLQQAGQMLDSLLSLVSWARIPVMPEDGSEGRPFVSVRMQLWLRELSRLVATVSPTPLLTFADDLTDLAKPLHLPVAHCRECHATGWMSVRSPAEGRLETDLQAIYRAYFGNHPDLCLLFPMTDTPPADTGGIDGIVCPGCAQLHSGTRGGVCPSCGTAQGLVRAWEPDMRRNVQRDGVNLVRSHNDCPFCGAQDGLSLIGSRAASLSSVLIARLFATPYNDHRKLIAFSDSVQDAAHRAGFFGARTYSSLIRGAITRFVMAQGDGLPLSVMAEQMPRYWRNRLASDARFTGTFIAPNMEWLRDYEELRNAGRLPPDSDLPRQVERRLTWEVFQAFSLRARIGRTLERSLTAAIGVDLQQLQTSAERLGSRLGEAIISLRGVDTARVQAFLLGLLWRLRVQGAMYHPMLDAYIQARGRPWELYRTPHMPNYGGAARPPAFVTLNRLGRSFEALLSRQRSGITGWFNKTLAVDEGVLATAEYGQAIQIVLEQLVRDGFLVELSAGGELVWGLDPARWRCSTQVAELACERCGHRIQVPEADQRGWRQLPCLRGPCPGHYAPATASVALRSSVVGEPVRLVPAEHSALLTADTRHSIEKSFIQGDEPWDVNLLSATPTLEMGIDIGDLSTVLLCSVPPTQSNYLQRIGRAGRRDGNALAITLANAQKHDLYFNADPLAMLAGDLKPPGIFLQATAVLERQLLAFCFDRWAASGVAETAVPARVQEVLDGVEANTPGRFPLSLLEFVERHRGELIDDFLAFFPNLAEESRDHLAVFLTGEAGASGMALRLMNRLHQLVQERRSHTNRIDRLRQRKQALEAQPADEAVQEELEGVLAERGALLALRRRINGQATLNFLTDEGLLPNYAFPEEGVTIQSIILRRLGEGEREVAGAGQRYERINFQIQRPAQSALSELAPLNRFYAVGHQVEIDQVDLSVSGSEDWRFCDRCHYMENVSESGDPHRVCPRCGSAQWADASRRRTLIRLRQVFATADDRTSRIGDDSDQRAPSFYNRQMLVDVPAIGAAKAYRLAAPQLPFGFEYLPRVRLREVNFGQPMSDNEEFAVAGEHASRPGFQLCRHCGKVRRRDGRLRPGFQHAYDCRLRRPDAVESDADYFESLYLYRELESEAVRILLPLAEVGSSGVRLHSLIAALNLGLRRYFRGNVAHIQVAHQSEPADGEARRHYLVMYDSVPGGSGYLKELLRRPDNLLALLQGAWEVISRCECREQEDRDGCYRCVLAYRESRKMDEISRRVAEDILAKILAEAGSLEPIDSLASIDINTLLESELEQRFVDALSNAPGVAVSPQLVNGKPGYFVTIAALSGDGRAAAWKLEPQVNLGSAQGVAVGVKPDFVFWPVREEPGLLPVTVFVDGFQFHYDKFDDDTLKRQALLDSGNFRVWSLGWHMLPIAGARQVNAADEMLRSGQQALMQDLFTRLSSRAAWEPYQAYGGFIAGGSFSWLLAYLSGSEQGQAMLRYAALSRALGWLDHRTMQDQAFRRTFLDDLTEGLPGEMRDEWIEGEGDVSVLGGLMRTAGTEPDSGPVRISVRLPRSAMEAASRGTLDGLEQQIWLHMAMDDREARREKPFELAWGAYWGATNLMQFLPRLTISSLKGVRAGLYMPLFRSPPESSDDLQPALDEAARWREISDLSLMGDRVDLLREAGVPVPEVGVELLDRDGVVLPELEFVWPQQRLAIAEDISPDEISLFKEMGWTVFSGLNANIATELASRLVAS